VPHEQQVNHLARLNHIFVINLRHCCTIVVLSYSRQLVAIMVQYSLVGDTSLLAMSNRKGIQAGK